MMRALPSNSQTSHRLLKAVRRVNHKEGAFDTLEVIGSTLLKNVSDTNSSPNQQHPK
jgi:hypothetical protein